MLENACNWQELYKKMLKQLTRMGAGIDTDLERGSTENRGKDRVGVGRGMGRIWKRASRRTCCESGRMPTKIQQKAPVDVRYNLAFWAKTLSKHKDSRPVESVPDPPKPTAQNLLAPGKCTKGRKKFWGPLLILMKGGEQRRDVKGGPLFE